MRHVDALRAKPASTFHSCRPHQSDINRTLMTESMAQSFRHKRQRLPEQTGRRYNFKSIQRKQNLG
jgi:hypothetical protein